MNFLRYMYEIAKPNGIRLTMDHHNCRYWNQSDIKSVARTHGMSVAQLIPGFPFPARWKYKRSNSIFRSLKRLPKCTSIVEKVSFINTSKVYKIL